MDKSTLYVELFLTDGAYYIDTRQ